MNNQLSRPCTAFEGTRLLLSGPLVEVALAVKAAAGRGGSELVLTFDDATGAVMDLDLRGTTAQVVERLALMESADAAPGKARRAAPDGTRGRGRPRLGVVSREVTLLPRHWEWLAAQPGGASVVLRRLVDEARRNGGTAQQVREAQERAYRFMSALAGDLPGFEEATRALFASDRARLDACMASWPAGIRQYALRLAYGENDNV